MKERPYSTFYARLLGGFSFSGDGQEIPIKGNLRSKYLQVLVMLLKAGKDMPYLLMKSSAALNLT